MWYTGKNLFINLDNVIGIELTNNRIEFHTMINKKAFWTDFDSEVEAKEAFEKMRKELK